MDGQTKRTRFWRFVVELYGDKAIHFGNRLMAIAMLGRLDFGYAATVPVQLDPIAALLECDKEDLLASLTYETIAGEKVYQSVEKCMINKVSMGAGIYQVLVQVSSFFYSRYQPDVQDLVATCNASLTMRLDPTADNTEEGCKVTLLDIVSRHQTIRRLS